MYFRKQLQCVAFGCFCTLAGVLLSSSVLPLFGTSDGDVFYDTVYCKALTVYGEDNKVLAVLGNSRTLLGGNEERGTLMLTQKDDGDLHGISRITNSSLVFLTANDRRIVELGDFDNSGRLLLKSDKGDGMTVVGEKDGEFAFGIFSFPGRWYRRWGYFKCRRR